MPRTTSATSTLRLRRIFRLHHHLRTMQSFSAEELAAFCLEIDLNANARLIRGDLGLLRELGAPIPKGHKHTKFRYIAPFSLLENLEGVNTAETDEVLAYLNQLYLKIPRAAFLELDKVFLALENRIRTAEAQGDPRLQFEKIAYTGQAYVTTLFDFIQKQRTIQFGYRPFGRDSREHTVFPVFLKEFNHRWFLIGYDRTVSRYQNYALDRIVGRPRLSDWRPQVEKLPDPTTYFQSLMGVSLEGDRNLVKLRVQKPRAHYIRTKPWHASQQEVGENDDWIDFQWEVLLNRELKAKILELGADAEVLEPEVLRDEIKGILKRATSCYE